MCLVSTPSDTSFGIDGAGLCIFHQLLPEIIFSVNVQRDRANPQIHCWLRCFQIKTVLLGADESGGSGFSGLLLDRGYVGWRIAVMVREKLMSGDLKAPVAQVSNESGGIAYSAKGEQYFGARVRCGEFRIRR